MVIRSFRDREAEKLFQDQFSKKYQSIERIARHKLTMLDPAETLEDIAALPGDRLEALKGDRKGEHSVRINERYRVCFVWIDGQAFDVEIADYH